MRARPLPLADAEAFKAATPRGAGLDLLDVLRPGRLVDICLCLGIDRLSASPLRAAVSLENP
jgi:hypothetical protein